MPIKTLQKETGQYTKQKHNTLKHTTHVSGVFIHNT